MKTTMMIGVSLTLAAPALIAPAWGSGNDHFNAGIDAERPGFSSDTSTSSTASDVDHEGGNLTDRDRQMIASLTNSAWGTLVSIANGQAKYRDGNRTYFRDIPAAPTPKPQPRQVHTQAPAPPSPAPAPAYSPPPAPAYTAPPAPDPVAADPGFLSMRAPAPQLPAVSQETTRLKKNAHFSDLDEALRAIGHRRINQPRPGTPLSETERTLSRVLNMAWGAAGGAAVKGSNLTRHPGVEGAVFGLAMSEVRRYYHGSTPMDAVARNILHTDADEWALRERVARHLSRPERQRIIDAARDVVREERSRQRREHGK